MRKVTIWFLVLALLVALSGCGAARRDAKAVGIFYYSFEDEFLSEVRIALNDDLTSRRISYENYDAVNDQETQDRQIRSAAENGTKLFFVNLVSNASADAAENILRLAGEGATVVFFNRSVEPVDAPESLFDRHANTAFIGTETGRAGHLQGEMIGAWLREHYDEADRDGDGAIRYVMLKGSEISQECAFRTRFSVEDADALLRESGRSGLEFFDPGQTTPWQTDPNNAWSGEAARVILEEDLAGYNDENGSMIELVICNNDAMAVGAVTALQGVGYNAGDPARIIPVFGIDATEVAQALIRDGHMTGTIRQSSSAMAAAMAAAAQEILSGQSTARAIRAAAESDAIYSVDGDHPNKLVIAYTAYP